MLSKFPSCLGKKFWVMVRENSVGARSRNKAERKKNPDFCLVSQKN